MELRFSGPIWHWRGPAPHHFVTVPETQAVEIEAVSRRVTYGWGMIPVVVQIGSTTWTTSLFPKDGGYVLPLKLAVRRAEALDIDDVVDVRLSVEL